MNLFLLSLFILNLGILTFSQEQLETLHPEYIQQEDIQQEDIQQEDIQQEDIQQEPIAQASTIGRLQSITIPKQCTVPGLNGSNFRCSFGEVIMDLNNLICRPSVSTRPPYTNPIRPLPAGVGCIAKPLFTDVLYKIYKVDNDVRQLLDSYIKSYSIAAKSYSTLAVLLGLELRDEVFPNSGFYYPVNSIDVHNNGTHLEIVGFVKTKDYPAVGYKKNNIHKEPDPKLVNRFYNKFMNYFSKA
jgi:hypothetical protein